MTTFNKQELSAKFGLVKGVIAKNSTINSIKMLNFRVSNHKFKLTGSNGEIQVTATGECIGDESFNVCVMPSTFGVMLGSAKNDIDIVIKDTVMMTGSARSKFNIPTIDGQSYPLLKLDGEVNEFNLKELIESVYKAASKNPAMPFMCGTCIDIKDGNIHAVATSGSSLFLNKAELEADDIQVIIPNFSAEYLANNDTDGFIVSTGSLKAISKQNNIEVICKLVDGMYPKWRNIITEYPNEFTVDRQELIESISTINKIEGIDSVNLTSFEDSLTISAKDGSGASIINEIEYQGDEINYNLSPEKLLSCLQSVSVGKITIRIDPSKGIQSRNDGHMFILAGIRR